MPLGRVGSTTTLQKETTYSPNGMGKELEDTLVSADNGNVHVNAVKWATGVLEPTTAQVEHGTSEEANNDEGMPEPRLEPQVLKGADRSKLPQTCKSCSTSTTLWRWT